LLLFFVSITSGAVAAVVMCASHLWLFQLLSKRHNKTTSKCLSAQRQLLSVDIMMTCVTDGQQEITEAQALYVLARRHMELHRWVSGVLYVLARRHMELHRWVSGVSLC